MADDFKARLPPPCSPLEAGYAGFRDWRRIFTYYQLASQAFPSSVSLQLQQARLFNLAGPDFTRFVEQSMEIKETSSIKEILDHVEMILKPQRHDLKCRMKLFDMKQTNDASSFLQLLRTTYLDSNYGESIKRDILIRDLFIHGLRDDAARRLIFQQNLDTLTTENCLSLVTSFETSNVNCEALSNESATCLAIRGSQKVVQNSNNRPFSSNRSTPSHSWSPTHRRCYGCGGQFHNRQDCPAWGKSCNKCQKMNHFAKVCQSSYTRKVADIAQEEEVDCPLTVATLQHRSKSERKLIGVRIKSSKPIKFIVDCGSDITVIQRFVAIENNLMKFVQKPRRYPMCLGASKTPLKFSGFIPNATLEINGYILLDNIWISDTLCDPAILGQSALKQFQEVVLKSGGNLPPLIVSTLREETSKFNEDKAIQFCSKDGRDYSYLQEKFPIFNKATGFVKNIHPASVFPGVDKSISPVRIPSRIYNSSQKRIISDEVGRLLKEGRIRKSNSSWRSQVLIVPGTKPRMVIDYAPSINRFTPHDAYPMPLIQDVLNEAQKYKVFSYIDLRSAFHQFEINESEKAFTAFEADGELYEWNCIPFGLRNSPAAFCRSLKEILRGLTGVISYMDDLVIGGTDVGDHDSNLSAFFQRAMQYGLSLNANKCIFGGKRLTFVGHIIENNTIRPDPSRTSSFHESALSTPSTQKQLHRLIGMAVYFSKWIPNFSDIMDPLFVALERKSFPLSKECLDAIQKMSQELKKAVLHIPDPKRPLCIETDASGKAVGATLTQDGRPISFMSRRLSKSEQKWSPAELEGYAVILSIRKFKHFLNAPFTILSDQQGVVSALNSHSGVKNAKFARWRLEMAEFDFEVIYRPGLQNVAADALSRCCTLSSNQTSTSYYKQLVLEWHNRLCHPGETRLYQFLQKHYGAAHIPNCQFLCKTVCNSCVTCARIKPRWLRQVVPQRLIKSKSPMERWSIDFMTNKPRTNDGKTNILMVVDEFSRFPFAFATADRSSSTIKKALKQLFYITGPPASIHSDRGSEFFSDELMTFFGKWGIHKSRTSPYNPQGNGQCERYNGVLWRSIECILEEQRLPKGAWNKVLPEALASMRILPCQATKSSPHDLFFAFERLQPGFDFVHIRKQSIDDSFDRPKEIIQVRNFVRNKSDPQTVPVELISSDANSGYATIKRLNESACDTVNIRDLALLPTTTTDCVPNKTIETQEQSECDQPIEPPNSTSQTGEDSQFTFTRRGRPIIKPSRFVDG